MSTPEQVNGHEPSKLVGPDGVTPAAEHVEAAEATATALAAPPQLGELPAPTMAPATDAAPVTTAPPPPGTIGEINRISDALTPPMADTLASMNPPPNTGDFIFTLLSMAAKAAVTAGLKEADYRAIAYRATQLQYEDHRSKSRVLTPDFSGGGRRGGRRG